MYALIYSVFLWVILNCPIPIDTFAPLRCYNILNIITIINFYVLLILGKPSRNDSARVRFIISLGVLRCWNLWLLRCKICRKLNGLLLHDRCLSHECEWEPLWMSVSWSHLLVQDHRVRINEPNRFNIFIDFSLIIFIHKHPKQIN